MRSLRRQLWWIVLLGLIALSAALYLRVSASSTDPHHGQDQRREIEISGLYPKFNPTISDYVAPCHQGEVQVHIDPIRGERIVLDGPVSPPSVIRGPSVRRAPIRSGASLTISVRRDHTESDYHVRCLPPDFPHWRFRRYSAPAWHFYAIGPGLGGASNYVIIFDSNGTPVWWYRASTPTHDFEVLPDGDVSWSRSYGSPYGVDAGMGQEIHSLDGQLVRFVQAIGSGVADHHEFQQLANGDVLLISYRPVAETMDLSAWGGSAGAHVTDATIEELGPQGNLVWSWSSLDHISLDELAPHWDQILEDPLVWPDGQARYDLTHLNSIEPAGRGRFLISMRRLDAIFMIDKSSGQVIWKLGGTTTAQSLQVLGETTGEGPLGSQHDARLWPDGTISAFDNSTGLERAPRMVRFRIDESARTAEIIETRSDLEVGSSGCCGSARLAPDGSWFVGWGSPIATEFAPNGQIALRFDLEGDGSYRALPVERGVVQVEDLRAGMDAIYESRVAGHRAAGDVVGHGPAPAF